MQITLDFNLEAGTASCSTIIDPDGPPGVFDVTQDFTEVILAVLGLARAFSQEHEEIGKLAHTIVMPFGGVLSAVGDPPPVFDENEVVNFAIQAVEALEILTKGTVATLRAREAPVSSPSPVTGEDDGPDDTADAFPDLPDPL